MKCMSDFDLKDKRVFIRTDFNVPLQALKDKNHIRLRAALKTISYALKNKARVVVASHMGRPSPSLKNKKELSLEPFGYYLGERLNCEVLFIEDLNSPVPEVLLSSLNEKKIILLENLRFHPGELKADKAWAETLARGMDIYINEAFSVSHREHASVCALPLFVKQRGQGFCMKEELKVLDHLLYQSSHPMALVIGGVKVSDKMQMLHQMAGSVDLLLVGGKMAYTFLKARGHFVPPDYVDKDSLKTAADLMDRLLLKGKKIFLPVDHYFSSLKEGKRFLHSRADFPKNFKEVGDIGPETLALFTEALKKGVRTVFWNGPLGHFEDPLFSEGTMKMCQVIASLKEAFCVAGGGNCTQAVFQSGLQGQFDYVSTGGGAALKYLSMKKQLPGIKALV